MRNFVLGVIFTVAVFIAGTLAYLLLGFAEVRGDVPGTRLESRLTTAAIHPSVRRRAPELANPFPPTDETLIAGGKILRYECAGCHGTPGEGHGLFRHIVSTSAAIAESRHAIYGSSDLLDREARHRKDRNVR
jgi:hypothetical protein